MWGSGAILRKTLASVGATCKLEGRAEVRGHLQGTVGGRDEGSTAHLTFTCRIRSQRSLVTLCRLKASKLTTAASGMTRASAPMDSQVLEGGDQGMGRKMKDANPTSTRNELGAEESGRQCLAVRGTPCMGRYATAGFALGHAPALIISLSLPSPLPLPRPCPRAMRHYQR